MLFMKYFTQLSVMAFLYSSACTGNKHKLQSDTVSAISSNKPSVVKTRYSYQELSKQFDLAVDFTRYTNLDSFATKAFVTDKQGVLLDSMISGTRFYWGNVFASDTNVRSYTTNINDNAEIVDD